VASIATSQVRRRPHPHTNIGKDHDDLVDTPSHADTGRPSLDEPGPTASPDGVADRRSQDDQPQAAEPPAWRVLLAYARPYRLALPLTAKRLVDNLAQVRSVTEALVWLAVLALANAGIGALGSYVLDRAAESVVLDARRRLVAHLVWLRIPAVDRSEPGDLMARVTACGPLHSDGGAGDEGGRDARLDHRHDPAAARR
jgi:hypothetical protein